MRFDPVRAIQMADRLGTFPRRDDALVGLLEEGFQALGWRVGRLRGSVIASRAASVLAPVRILVRSPIATVTAGSWTRRIRRATGRLRGLEDAAPDVAEVGVRAGLALLLELARTWPTSRASRMDLALAVEAGRDLEAAEHGLGVKLSPDVEPTPSLFLDVQAPGLGQGVLIGGRDRDLAIAAARDLWIPHREARMETRLRHSAVIVGDGLFQDETTIIDPAALDRTAQLVTEVALRWAKAQGKGPAAVQEDGRSASRSSQNPG